MSVCATFIVDCSIVRKSYRITYIDQSNNSSQRVFGFNTSRLIDDWSVENLTPNMTPYGMSLEVNGSKKKHKNAENI